MDDNSRTRNLAVLVVLALLYVVTAFCVSFIPNQVTSQTMLDIVSVPMLVFGIYSLWIILGEAWGDFWAGKRDRAALGFFGLTAILISVVVMRPYGIATRNIPGIQWLEHTHIYAIALYIQAIGLMLFTRGAAPTTVQARKSGIGQLVAGVIIGALIGASKVLEPILSGIGKVIGKVL